jgi:hypothetical protein
MRHASLAAPTTSGTPRSSGHAGQPRRLIVTPGWPKRMTVMPSLMGWLYDCVHNVGQLVTQLLHRTGWFVRGQLDPSRSGIHTCVGLTLRVPREVRHWNVAGSVIWMGAASVWGTVHVFRFANYTRDFSTTVVSRSLWLAFWNQLDLIKKKKSLQISMKNKEVGM